MLENIVRDALADLDTVLEAEVFARVVRCVGLLAEASGLHAALGSICHIQGDAGQSIPCEVVGFDGDRAFLMPLQAHHGIHAGALVRPPTSGGTGSLLPPLEYLLGRVVDGLGRPIDGHGAFHDVTAALPLPKINPMARHPVDDVIDVGVGVINGLLTVGRGQRVGLFAGSGVGKSVLLGMLARLVDADVVVVGLIGERGREVQEFIVDNLGDGLSKSVVVASPADDSAALRIRGARLATEIAERFRAQGKQVLLLMDSLTRVAQAQREIGLAMGEPPSTKGYTPSAFAILPTLVERAGNAASRQGGSITAFYTVLMEEDDLQDPVVDASRAILDGHIVLGRHLAEQGIYPAVDIAHSISRVMPRVVDAEQIEVARRFRQLWQAYAEQQDLINIGAYQRGSNAEIDAAIVAYPALCEFVRQSPDSRISSADARSALQALFAALPAAVT